MTVSSTFTWHRGCSNFEVLNSSRKLIPEGELFSFVVDRRRLVVVVVVVFVVSVATRNETKGPPRKIVPLGDVKEGERKRGREKAVENKKTTGRDGNGASLDGGGSG